MNKNTSRRAFLKACGMMGAGLAAGAVVPAVVPTAARAARLGAAGYTVAHTRVQMGTFVTITAIDPSMDRAEEAVSRAFAEIDRLTAVFNRYDAATPVSHLNRTGALTDVAPEMAEVMARAARMYSISDANFDVTVAPVVDLMQARSNPDGSLNLSGAEMKEALALVDGAAVRVARNRISFDRAGMAVTLDGIAKGYIVDRASDVLAACGVRHSMVNAGGDIRLRGGRAEGTPWAVAVEDPEKHGHYPARIRIFDGAIATSGNYEVFFDRQKIHHHVVVPGSGICPRNEVSVSVTAPTVMQADALSTTTMVMGVRAGVGFIDALPGAECLVVTRTGANVASRGWNA
ncbi:MAG: FAD:protein FMN transferase [Desulfovibrionaceae bacterium]|jgi:thiamine biosynthesis lipoprotein|nr:FAD:protein FMN transferase [Desulfovibrionaceae bacterium]